ncbi:hypothetical protein ACWCRD_02940 [Streptomyces sp. NPDC002092]
MTTPAYVYFLAGQRLGWAPSQVNERSGWLLTYLLDETEAQ